MSTAAWTLPRRHLGCASSAGGNTGCTSHAAGSWEGPSIESLLNGLCSRKDTVLRDQSGCSISQRTPCSGLRGRPATQAFGFWMRNDLVHHQVQDQHPIFASEDLLGHVVHGMGKHVPGLEVLAHRRPTRL